ncbi:MAG: hypothetical protein Q8867_03255 [Bacteroidota bacterium]|nr:hypothetical protein [Bacteroidota bacterium]
MVEMTAYMRGSYRPYCKKISGSISSGTISIFSGFSGISNIETTW